MFGFDVFEDLFEKAGKLADLVVLDGDYLTVPADQIQDNAH